MKLDTTDVMTLENEPMDVVWKDTHAGQWENLTKLLQFAWTYATTTIDKETKVQMLLMEKEQKIMLLEQKLA